jgi:hypothetical protein
MAGPHRTREQPSGDDDQRDFGYGEQFGAEAGELNLRRDDTAVVSAGIARRLLRERHVTVEGTVTWRHRRVMAWWGAGERPIEQRRYE